MISEAVPTTPDGIAIIGMAGRMPGANNVGEFWENLIGGRDCVTHFTDEELAASGYDPQALRALPGYVAARGTVDKAEWFDRTFFNILPKEAEVLDPQHRVLLEVAWSALEDAGCDPSRHPGLIGVFAGMSINTYFPFFLQQRPDLLQAVGIASAVIANEKDFLTNRLAYKLNLRGPALNIQTACSTSLVSAAIACQNLLNHECDVALAGGVALTFPQMRGYFSVEGGMTSTDGFCRPFDARANGTVFSNGVGVVVLKRLADAIEEGDQIYAVIKGHAVNNDGSQKVSFAAPSVDGHTGVIALAQAVAGFSPETISYVEAHGTATALGDPVEIAGLAQVFRAASDAKQFCAIGTVKGNLGHLDSASGVVSLIKTALALRHRQMPPSLHCEELNPALQIEESPFYINRELRAWPEGATPRRAGVSSFGVGGTNAHVVLEEAPELPATSPGRPVQTLLLSAKTATALERRALDLATHLEAHPEQPLADVAFTLETGRQIFQRRRAIVAHSSAEAITALREAAKLERTEDRLTTPVAFLFPGQGAQYPGMGAQLHASEPAFRAALDDCAKILRPEIGCDLREIIFASGADAAAQLRETRFTQPAIFAVGYALGRFWLSLGLKPAALLGHSVGEFAAATLAGVFSLADAARLVATRARLVQELPGGAMLAARLSEADARGYLGDTGVDIAAINSPKLCVLSGPFDAIEKLEEIFAEKKVAARRLSTSHAFHSAMMDPVVAPLAEAVAKIQLHAPTLPIVSSVTGRWMTPEQAIDPKYWTDHLRATVRFSEGANQLFEEAGCALLEVGPGQTLAQLARQCPGKTARNEIAHSLAEAVSEDGSIATALARLWMAGVPLDWAAIHAGETRRRVSLPTYAFDRQRYFADLPTGLAMPIATASTDGDPPVGARAQAVAPTPRIATSAAASEVSPAPEIAAPKVGTLEQVKALLAELSGLDLSDVPAATNLLELGFDSLFLSQVAQALTRKFGVKITFRQLLRELGTMETLAAHLDREAKPAEIVASQLEKAAPQPLETPAAPAVHGPFRPLQRELGASLTAQQQTWLEDFIRRSTARTPKSKQHTQTHRHHFADPRAVAGFKQVWKEMVYPIVVDRSAGAQLWDIDGNEWLDVTLSYGAAMLGHQPPFVVDAITAQLAKGMEIGPTSPLAGEVAGLLCELTGMERVTFCNTGSEAVVGAVRVARTITGRSRIVYFSESYHGIDNEVLGRRAGASVMPIAPGISQEAMANAIILDYGDPRALAAIEEQAGEIAAVLVEPVQSRRPGFQTREFMHELRALTTRLGIALIFDEIITGFRCHPGGAQGYFGVAADLATFGKVIGGGLPIGAIAGRAEYMDAFDGGSWRFGDDSFPESAVTFFAGTFVRHPLALAAARAVLTHLKTNGPALQQKLADTADGMIADINCALAGSPFSIENFTSNWLLRSAPDFKYSGLFFALLRHRGIHVWEGRPCFVSTAHTPADIRRVVTAFEESAAELESAGFFTRTKTAELPAANTITPTEGQREVWFVCQQNETASAAFNENWMLRLNGPLDLPALRFAIQTISDRHDALRCSFNASGEELVLAPTQTLEAPLIDLATLSDQERSARLSELRAAETHRVFDLQNGPLIALQVVRLAPDEHALLFNAHHLVCDGWSCDVFLHELATLYSARHNGRANPLPAAMQLRDFQAWEIAMQETPEFSADAAFWLEKYRTVPPTLQLPGDRPHPPRRSFRGANETLILPAAFAQTLAKAGAQQGATLFTFLLAGFKTLLFRLSGQTDLAVGIPCAGQNLAGGDHLIGHCVNMLPMRSQLDPEQSFSDLLGTVQTTVLEAFEHQRVTFGWLLRQLVLPRPPGRIPLIPVTFNLDPPLSQLQFDGLAHRLESNPRAAYQFDLGFNCDSTPAGFRMVCNYNTDLFDAATIRGFLAEYQAVLEAAAGDPDRPLGKLIAKDEPLSMEAQIEALFRAQPEVCECAVALRDDVSGGKCADVYLVRKPSARVEVLPAAAPSAANRDPVYDDVAYNVMKKDYSRIEYTRRAFRQTVKGKVVVDIGTGRDALFARMCIEEGARKVYAIELLEEPARQARELVAKLGLADRIVVLQGRSQEIQLPELADVCISETRGGDVILRDAKRFLREGGIILPARCQTAVAAVEMPADFLADPRFEEVGAYYAQQTWESVGHKHDMRLCVTGTSRALLRSSEDTFEDVYFGEAVAQTWTREINLAITQDARIDGFLTWWKWEAIAGDVLDAIEHPDSWLPIYLPVFSTPIAVRAGDRIVATVRGDLTENQLFRDYRIEGRVLRQNGDAVPFAFDSWQYKDSYKATPFYQRLFRDDSIRAAAAVEEKTDSEFTDALESTLHAHGFAATISLRPSLPKTSAGTVDVEALAQTSQGLTAAERQRILVEWNQTARPFPGDRGIHRVFEEQAVRTPEALAIVADEQRLTYRELNERANQLAQLLRTRGVASGACVGICLERGAELIIGILAILKTGGAYVPLDPAYPAERLKQMLDRTEATLVLTASKFTTLVPRPSAQIIALDQLDLSGQSTANLDTSSVSEALAYVMFTSGSTGEPKGVAIPHRAISRLVVNNDFAPFRADDVVAFASNICFDAATFEIWGALLNGGCLVATPAHVLLSQALLAEHFAAQKVSILFLTTSLFNQMAGLAPAMFAGLRHVVFGGEAADTHAVQAVLAHGKPKRLVNGYGPTETTTFAVCHVIERVTGPRVPIGRPIANTEAYILDEALEPVAVGVSGELYIGGPGVALGYYRAPELTAERFLDTPYGLLYRTGDLAMWLEDGTIDCLGRADQQIKLRGFRIEPAEIEIALRDQPGIGDCFVTAREFAPGDQRLVAWYRPSNGHTPPPEKLAHGLARALPPHMIPSAFVRVEKFPLTSNGKLDVKALPSPASLASAAAYAPPANSVQAQLTDIWQELLNKPRIGIRDDFFELGGHSLLAARMLTMIEQRLGKRLPLHALFEEATIAHLATALIHEQQRAVQETPYVSIHPKGTRQPFFFLHGDFVGGGVFCQNLARHLGSDRPFFAMHPHGLRGEAAPRTIEEMAAERLQDLRKLRPHGPYLLGGYCNGALVVYEMARMLEAAGEQIDALVLLAVDGANVRFGSLQTVSTMVSRVLREAPEARQQRFLRWRKKTHLADYYVEALRDLAKQPFSVKVKRFTKKARRVLRHLLPGNSQESRDAELPPPSEGSVAETFDDAWNSYVPGRFGGKAWLLWPNDDQPVHPSGPAFGWDTRCAAAEVKLVPGAHHTCITQDQHLRMIAAELREILDAADSTTRNLQALEALRA